MKAFDRSEKTRPVRREREFISSFLCFYIVSTLFDCEPPPGHRNPSRRPLCGAYVNQTARSFDLCLTVNRHAAGYSMPDDRRATFLDDLLSETLFTFALDLDDLRADEH